MVPTFLNIFSTLLQERHKIQNRSNDLAMGISGRATSPYIINTRGAVSAFDIEFKNLVDLVECGTSRYIINIIIESYYNRLQHRCKDIIINGKMITF